jgi:hypothetical protein
MNHSWRRRRRVAIVSSLGNAAGGVVELLLHLLLDSIEILNIGRLIIGRKAGGIKGALNVGVAKTGGSIGALHCDGGHSILS